MKPKQLDREQIKAVIFDMDGLLLDSESLALAAFRFACHSMDLGDQFHVFVKCIGANHARGEQIVHEELGAIADAAKFIHVWDEQYRVTTFGKAIPFKAGAVELLTQLSHLKIPIALATSSNTPRATNKLTLGGVIRHFNAMVCGDQVARSKPAPDIYLEAASRLSIAPANCLALEDSYNGAKAALAAGMHVIQVPDIIPASQELLRLGVREFPNLEQVRRRYFD